MKLIILKIRLICISLIFILVVGIIGISWGAKIAPIDLFNTEIGKPIVSHYPVNEHFGILQIVSTEDRVYILQESRCVVSAYTKDGIYLYTIYAYTQRNGRPHIAANRNTTHFSESIGVEQGLENTLPNNRLYLKDKDGNVYVFEDDLFVEFIPEDQGSFELLGLNFDEQSKEFVLKGASIYKYNTNGDQELVISRPFWLVFAQANFANLSTITLILMGTLIAFIGKKQSKL